MKINKKPYSYLYKKISIFLFFLLISTLSLSAQTIVKGQIKSEKFIISNASIVIYKNDKVVSYTYSKLNGFYQVEINLNLNENQDVKIVVSSLGFESQEKIISIDGNKEIVVNFELKEKVESLNEVVLEAWEKINVKKDTVTFKVSAFKDGSEQVVEDLLKNLPGVEVSDNGNIKVNGKAIDKLLIEGDDLFDDRYKLLSKNLDASVIDEVQILNNFEDNPVLKSFQESEKVALNLNLKEDKKNIWFGNADLGGGTNERYNSSANIGLLKKKIKIFNLSNLNNIGQPTILQVGSARTVNTTGINTDLKIEKPNNEIVNVDNTSSNFSNNEDVFNNSFLNSLSFVTNLSEKTKLRSLSYFALDRFNNQNSRFNQFFIEPELVQFSEQNTVRIRDIALASEFELKYLKSENTYLTYNFSIENNPITKNGNLIFNTETITQDQDDENLNVFNHLNITRKLSTKTLLLVYTYLGINRTEQELNITPNVFNTIFNNDEDIPIVQNSESPLTYYGAITEIAGKSNRSEYGLELTTKVDVDEVNSRFNFENELAIDSLSNKTSFRKTELSLSGRYSYKLSRKLRVSSSIKFAENFVNLNSNREQFFSINPSIRLNLSKTKFGNFGLGYSFRNNLPSIGVLNENFILRNYRTFTRGINTIEQFGNNNFNFFYRYSNFKKQFIINAFLSHSFSDNSYSSQSTITEQTNFNESIITDGNRFTNLNLSASKYLSPLASSIKFSTQQSWATRPTIINNVTNEVQNYNANYRIQGTTYFNIPLNFKFAAQYNLSRGEFNNQSTSNEYFESSLTSTLKISKKILLQATNNFYSINDNNFLFTNFLVSYTPEKSRFSFRLTGNNLGDIRNYSNVFISEIQRSETSVRVIPRYILLNVKYRF